MGAPAFTPGPWFAERRKTCSVVLQHSTSQDGYSNRVAECPQWSPAPYPQPTPDEAFANAALIAAAPELYEALSDIMENPLFQTAIGGNPNMIERLMARAAGALAKARGES